MILLEFNTSIYSVMINTSELRIGNMILMGGEPVVVKGIQTNTVLLDGVMRPAADGINIEYNPIPANDDAVQPLPLSDFLLESMKRGRIIDEFGVQHPYSHRRVTYTIRHDEEGYYIAMYKNDGPIHITPNHFHYYHQLQNIYYAQYGEEFEVSEHDVKIAWRTAKALNRV